MISRRCLGVLRNLKSRLSQYNRDKVSECLKFYGNPAARRVPRESYV